jgi:hypothetical protein
MTVTDHPGAAYDLVCAAVRFRMEIDNAPPGTIPSQLVTSIVRQINDFIAATIEHAKASQ